MSESSRVSLLSAVLAAAASVVRFCFLLISGRIHQPHQHVGDQLTFANGASARVFRETVVEQGRCDAPTVLIFLYRLRATDDWVQKMYLRASVLITPFVAGVPGFVSKMWLTFDENAAYCSIYEWDNAGHAESSAQAIQRILPLIAPPDSIAYHVISDTTRAQYLAQSGKVANDIPPGSSS